MSVTVRTWWRWYTQSASLQIVSAVLVVVCASWTTALAAELPEEPSRRARDYRDILLFDDDLGQWVAPSLPQAGTETGDLRLADRHLDEGRPKAARKLLKQWLKEYPDSEYLGQGKMLLGDCEYALGNYWKAYGWYNQVISEFDGTGLYAQALRRQMAIADVYLSGVKRKFLGMRILPAADEALDMLAEIEDLAADHRIAEVALMKKANFYYQTSDFISAEESYARLVREYPDSRYYQQALLLSAQAALASFSGTRFDATPLLEAQQRFERYQQEFPDQARIEAVDQTLERIRESQAQKKYEIADYYWRTNHLDAAAFYFSLVVEQFGDTIWAARADEALQQLG